MSQTTPTPDPVTCENLEHLVNAGTGLTLFVWKDTDNWPVNYVSDNVIATFGYSKQEFIDGGISFGQLLHRDDAERVNAEVEYLKSGKSGNSLTHEDYRVRHKNGHYIWVADTTIMRVDEATQEKLLFGYLIDITERKSLELKLETERNRLSLLLDATRLGTWEWNPQTDVTEFNERWAEMFGYAADELENHVESWSSRLHPDDRENAWQAIKNHLDGVTPFYESEHRILHRSGRWRYVLDRGRIIERDNEGRVTRYAGTVTDVTEQKLAEINARRAAHAKNVFLANMSHEIRTPLHGILGLASVLETTPISEYQRQLLHTIKESGDYLLNTLNDVLDLTRAEEGQLRIKLGTHSIEALLQHIKSLFGQRIKEKGLQFELQSQDALPKQVITDNARVIQIVSNLLSNAIKFTERGAVQLSAAWVSDSASRGELVIKVTDSGPGIKDTQRIWQLFEQEDDGFTRTQQGSGLGLAIVRHLVQLLNGTIQVDSQLGEGSCFTVCLPMAIHTGGGLNEEELSDLPLPEVEKFNVLVVDDNPINQMIVSEMLYSLGQQVTNVTSGTEAVSKLQQQSFDAVFMDLHMPHMDGMEASRAIRKLTGIQQPYIVALTADAYAETKTQAMQAGMNDYVTKPFLKEDLANVLSRITLNNDRNTNGI